MEETNDKNRGGKRLGAGRKPWSPFKESTKAIRIPESQEPVIRDFLEAFKHKQKLEQARNVGSIEEPSLSPTRVELPLFSSKVTAGLPSPADDHVEKRLDLNDYLIEEPEATFFITIKGDSMIDAKIFDGDIAIINKARKPKIGDIVLAEVDGEFTLKELARNKEGMYRLLPANSIYSPIEIREGMHFHIWGVYRGSVRKHK